MKYVLSNLPTPSKQHSRNNNDKNINDKEGVDD